MAWISNTGNIQVKVCCIKSLAEAEMAVNAGANAIGLVSKMPSGPGVIKDQLIREIAHKMSGRAETFLLTSQTSAGKIIEHYQSTLTSTIQLVDHVPHIDLQIIKESIPNVRLIQVIHIVDEHNIEEAISVSPFIDGILLDSGNPNLTVKTLGGTGNTHNWNISRQIVEEVKVPVFLAGGLNSNNVQLAIESVQPYGIDLCSGLRINDQLDLNKLSQFMAIVKADKSS